MISMERLSEVLQDVEWDEVWRELAPFFGQRELELAGTVYQAIFRELRRMPVVDTSMRIVIFESEEGEVEMVGRDGLLWRDIVGIDANHPYADREVDQALEFKTWGEMLSMEVVMLTTIPRATVAAHCLYRMTFFGFTAESAETRASYPVVLPN